MLDYNSMTTAERNAIENFTKEKVNLHGEGIREEVQWCILETYAIYGEPISHQNIIDTWEEFFQGK